jgi:hypothetical protein
MKNTMRVLIIKKKKKKKKKRVSGKIVMNNLNKTKAKTIAIIKNNKTIINLNCLQQKYSE